MARFGNQRLAIARADQQSSLRIGGKALRDRAHRLHDSASARIAAAGGVAARLQAGLRENEWSVLFLMRIVPAVPFVLANLIPAFVGTSLFRFSVSTFLGIIPGALVFTSVGSGLGEVFARGETPDLGILFTPAVLGPILGLAALAALPMVLRAFKRTR
ncbi:MAG: VTT domain-containing protein [Rhodobacteraceae bacterium]|nr:VTT domain-containing protein [Paracoccaceae bacterium]